jgi:hypothetical protein
MVHKHDQFDYASWNPRAHLSNSAQSVNGVVSAKKVRQLTAESALTTVENARHQPSTEHWSTRLLLKSIDIARNRIPENKKTIGATKVSKITRKGIPAPNTVTNIITASTIGPI